MRVPYNTPPPQKGHPYCGRCRKYLFSNIDAKLIISTAEIRREKQRKEKYERRYYPCPHHKGKYHVTSQ